MKYIVRGSLAGIRTVRSSHGFKGFSTLSEKDFLLRSEQSLHEIVDIAESLEEYADIMDVSYSQGVVSINIDKIGSWVINKQAPNRQIWWSSPFSGPRRYEFIGNENGKWVCSKSNSALLDDISMELKRATDSSVVK